MLSSYISLAYQEQLFGVDPTEAHDEESTSICGSLEQTAAGTEKAAKRNKEQKQALLEFLKPPPLPLAEPQANKGQNDSLAGLPKTGTTRVLVEAPVLTLGTPAPEPLGDMRAWMTKERKEMDLKARASSLWEPHTVYDANAIQWPWKLNRQKAGHGLNQQGHVEGDDTHGRGPWLGQRTGGRVLSTQGQSAGDGEREREGDGQGAAAAAALERRPVEAAAAVSAETEEEALTFESRFESGNLLLAQRTDARSYDLTLRTDYFTEGHAQWYYFAITRSARLPASATDSDDFRLRIVNLMKPDSLFNHGLRPLVNSVKSGKGWVRMGEDICYYENGMKFHKKSGHTLAFTLSIEPGDTVFIAHCYPYSYSDLQRDLDEIERDPVKTRLVRRRTLCHTVAGNPCDVVMITDPIPSLSVQARRPVVIITARVHPGESNASWMMKGVIDFLLGASAEARLLRDQCDVRLVPMLNPDGVINGNYRCNLSGHDLNRRYKAPSIRRHPTIVHLKELVRTLIANNRQILLFCDLHGHSIKPNIFAYGCDSSYRAEPTHALTQAAHPRMAQLFSFMLHQESPLFSFQGCSFKVQRSKDATSRVVMWRELGVDLSFTLEASFCGADHRASADKDGLHFNTQDLMGLGASLCKTILKLRGLMEDEAGTEALIQEMDAAFPREADDDEAYTSSDDQAIASEEEDAPRAEQEPGMRRSMRVPALCAQGVAASVCGGAAEFSAQDKVHKRLDEERSGGMMAPQVARGEGRSRRRLSRKASGRMTPTETPVAAPKRASTNFLSTTKARVQWLESRKEEATRQREQLQRQPPMPARGTWNRAGLRRPASGAA